MLVLGIETSTPAASVCLASDAGLIAHAAIGPGTDATRRAHAAFVSPAIRWCLDRAGVALDQIGGIAVSLGPGLFTGMRVGLAAAQALAHARRLPMVGLASLDLLAFEVQHARRLICSVIDARRGELFWAFYRPVPGGAQRTSEFRCGRPERLAGELEAQAEDALCVGDGALGHRALLEAVGADVGTQATAHPSAVALVELALPRFLREETQRAEELQPIYIRSVDAKIGWAQRGALRGGAGLRPTTGSEAP